ncbi:MAG TPA: TMEM175 family protein [Candidatus Dormibacteraeota bacterium]|nr:TMEM175 family protein [Candidatus Dormibacteraeota bacterium]
MEDRDLEARQEASSLGRVEAFSDGVMAVIITIMAFQLKPPATPDAAGMADRLPELLVYALSFAFVGIYWNNHHHLLRSAARLSAAVMWSNLLLLFWLSLIPVLTAWIANDYARNLPAAVYGIDALLAALAYFALVRALISANGRDSTLARAVARDVKGRVSMVLYVAGVVSALIIRTPWVAYALYVAVSVMWIVPDRRLAPSK